MDQKNNVGVLSADAAKELQFSDEPLRVVFAIDASGEIKGFHTAECCSHDCSTTESIHAGEIQKIEMITLIKTSNPKWCYKTTAGHQVCISW
ncbi:MAG: hypothetical protein GXP14_01400 [Gammaproteobacteria bacterium]|nr:hypothetical protein [Gammaproteobacteria bacterium]